MATDTHQITDRVQAAGTWVAPLREEMSRVLIGQGALVDRMLIGLLTGGHLLLEGVPGLAKTLTVNALAGCLDADFRRIQFTPDLLPADVVGTLIYNPQDGQFSPKLGPVFSNLLLADEINRAPAKVQSALLEAMQERQVTIGEETYPLPEPFLVMATQNPLDQEGTYQLPEAQLDRFLLKVSVGYPSRAEEKSILDLMGTSAAKPQTRQVAGRDAVASAREATDGIYIDDSIKDYIISLVFATREPADVDGSLAPLIRCGASPRATINLALAARAAAFLSGRGYVVPSDVKSIAPDVLRHRVLVTYEAEAEDVDSDALIGRILDAVPVP